MFERFRRKKSDNESIEGENSQIYWKKNPKLQDHIQWFKVIDNAPRVSNQIYVHRIVITNGLKQFYKHYVTKRWFIEKGFVPCSYKEYEKQLKSGIY